jgi:hypothetical protein
MLRDLNKPKNMYKIYTKMFEEAYDILDYQHYILSDLLIKMEMDELMIESMLNKLRKIEIEMFDNLNSMDKL